MTTIIKGVIYFSSRFRGEKRNPRNYLETIEGDSQRANGSDTIRSVYLNGLRAFLEVYNTDERGVFLAPNGPEKNQIKLTRRGEAWTPQPGQPIRDGFPIMARVKDLGQVEIEWSPRSGKENNR
ncbi:MAG: hypothetical protein AAB574_00975 [Patescibacteria group bacterium]